MIAVTGYRTTIVRELAQLTDEPIERINVDLARFDCELSLPDADRIVLAAGVLHQAPILEQRSEEIAASLAVNLVNAVRVCELALKRRANARICIIGSQSGVSGSYDQTYALAKAGIHAYVTWRPVLPTQSLVCIAPPIIADSGMTERRSDYPEILRRREHVTARYVAQHVHRVLYGIEPGMHFVMPLHGTA